MIGPSSGRIEGGTHLLALRVYYEDTDAAGIVYYANWLRFLERGRTEFLRLLGQEHRVLHEERSVNWVVRRCTIDYIKPARLDDVVEVVTSLKNLRGASLEMGQQVRRGAAILVSADVTAACMADSGKPVRVPPALRAALAEFQRGVAPLTPYSDIKVAN